MWAHVLKLPKPIGKKNDTHLLKQKYDFICCVVLLSPHMPV
jgi:hypothetical protein